MIGPMEVLDRPSSRSASGSAPVVSIGLPVYNGERYLVRAIDSILGQTYGDLELVICDNASTDATQRICLDYQGRDGRVRYFRNDVNLGAAYNYNHVFHLARGRYFKWAAADDLCQPDMVEKCATILDSNPYAVVSYVRTRIIDDRGAVLRDYDDDLHLHSPSPRERFTRLLSAIGECNAVFGLIRSRHLAQTALIGSFIGSDVCLLAELSLYGQIVQVPEYLFLRREHAEASSCKRSVDEQLEFFDPKKTGRIALPHWRKMFQNFRSVRRAPIGIRQKVSLLLHLARRIISARQEYLAELGAALGDVLRGPRRRPVRKIKGCALPVKD